MDGQTPPERASVMVLRECIELQNKKSKDYQNDKSTVKQADYYVNGVSTIYDIMHAKMLRLKSVMEAMQNDQDYNPNFESLEDSARDLINYSSFFCAYLRGEVDGQDANKNVFNRLVKVKGDQTDDSGERETPYTTSFYTENRVIYARDTGRKTSSSATIFEDANGNYFYINRYGNVAYLDYQEVMGA